MLFRQKIRNTCGPVKETDYNARVAEIESKKPSTLGLATIPALAAGKNEIPGVISLVKEWIMI